MLIIEVLDTDLNSYTQILEVENLMLHWIGSRLLVVPGCNNYTFPAPPSILDNYHIISLTSDPSPAQAEKMKPLEAKTLELHEFMDNTIPEYAILSHRRGNATEDVSFLDIQSGKNPIKIGYEELNNYVPQPVRKI